MPTRAASRVGLFIPHNENRWEEFSGFAQAAAQAIGLNLKVYTAGHSTDRMLEQVRFDLNEIAGQMKSGIGLTPNERSWIREHPLVSVGAVPDWAPFDMVDDKGEYIGVTRDIIDLIAQRSGLRFVFKTDTWSRLLEGIGKGQYDLLGSVYYTAERDRFLIYTQPYFEVLDYFFVRDDLDVRNLSDLQGMRVAMPRSYALADKLEKFFPQLEVVPVDSTPEALEAVLEGRADILYDAYAVLNHLLHKQSIGSIVPFKSTRHRGSFVARVSRRPTRD